MLQEVHCTEKSSENWAAEWGYSALLSVFMLQDALSVWTNLGKHSLFVWLFVSNIKTGTRNNKSQDELSSVVRRLRRTAEDSSSRRIMRLVPVFNTRDE